MQNSSRFRRLLRLLIAGEGIAGEGALVVIDLIFSEVLRLIAKENFLNFSALDIKLFDSLDIFYSFGVVRGDADEHQVAVPEVARGYGTRPTLGAFLDNGFLQPPPAIPIGRRPGANPLLALVIRGPSELIQRFVDLNDETICGGDSPTFPPRRDSTGQKKPQNQANADGWERFHRHSIADSRMIFEFLRIK